MTEPLTNLEERLSMALKNVADQTEPISPSGGRYEHANMLNDERSGNGPSRTVWLAVATILVVGFGAIGYSAYDRIGTTEAASQSDLAPEVTDGPLYLLPPEGFPLSADLEYKAGDDVNAENDLSAIAVGRRTESGYEDLYAIFHSTDFGSFSIEPDSSQMFGDRELSNSYDEGVGEQLEDGTWIIYQTEFEDPRLERLVVSTSVVDGLLTFTDPEGLLEVVASVADVDGSLDTTISSFPETDEAPEPGGPVLGFILTTSNAETPEEALYHATSLAAPDLQEFVVEETGDVIHLSRASFGVSLVAWAPAPGKVAAAMIMGGDEEAVVDFVTNMRIVDAETWDTELSGQG